MRAQVNQYYRDADMISQVMMSKGEQPYKEYIKKMDKVLQNLLSKNIRTVVVCQPNTFNSVQQYCIRQLIDSKYLNKVEYLNLNDLFADLNAVPRPSKKEERVIEFMKNFGNTLGLETFEDEIRNVIIRKPATLGMENRKTVVLQGHLDMVHQKNADTIFDFDTQGIEMYVDGDWVRARGTTLGADNGLGVAMIMAVLESTTMKHPAIEALFTIDEETGMTGALNLKGGVLKGEILLNMDTEEDDEIDIGCAGGVDVTAVAEYDEEDTPADAVGYTITVKGLNGGHSGMDIDKGLGNANKIMNRLLFNGFEDFGLQISTIHGGSLRNAIPRESIAQVAIAPIYDEAFTYDMQEVINEIKAEFKTTEPNLEILIEKSATTPTKVMPPMAQFYMVRSIYTAHNGVYRMSADFDNLVETSNNIAKIRIVEMAITHIDCPELKRRCAESWGDLFFRPCVATCNRSRPK